MASITIGSGSQTFNQIMDTGSGVLWVGGTAMSYYFQDTFSCKESSTCTINEAETMTIEYAQGAIEGYYTNDTVTFGGLTLPNMRFLTIFDAADLGQDITYDGLCGLGFSGNASFPLLVTQMKEAGLISTASFSVYLGNDPEASGTTTGEIVFGGYDSQYMNGNFSYFNVVDPNYWAINIYSIGYGSTTLKSFENYEAVIDTGTSFMILPKAVITNLMTQIESQGHSCSFDESVGLHQCDCSDSNEYSDLSFQFDNLTNFTIPSSAYVQYQDGSCYLLMESSSNVGNNQTVLGDVFIRNYYAMFNADTNQIALAPAANPSGSHWILIVGIILAVIVLVGIMRCVYISIKKKKAISQQLLTTPSFNNNYNQMNNYNEMNNNNNNLIYNYNQMGNYNQ
jgi:hypothetical protein